MSERIEHIYVIDGHPFFVAYWQDFELDVNFEVKRIDGFEMETEEPMWFEGGEAIDKANAPIYVRGHVKWDGCSNYTFPASESCMEHECDRSGLVALGTLLGRVFDQCAAMMGDKVLDDIGQQPVVVDRVWP